MKWFQILLLFTLFVQFKMIVVLFIIYHKKIKSFSCGITSLSWNFILKNYPDDKRYFLFLCLLKLKAGSIIPSKCNMLKDSNRNNNKTCENLSKLTIVTPEQRHWCRFGVFMANFEHISHYFSTFSASSVVDLEQVNICRVDTKLLMFSKHSYSRYRTTRVPF